MKIPPWWGRRRGWLSLLLLGSGALLAGDMPAAVEAWLARQPDIRTWQADVIQTRSLRSLTRSLTNTGRVWFSAPNRFRWELGEPTRSIAVRRRGDLLLLYPALRRAEIYALEGRTAGPWAEALVLMEAGFPRGAAELGQRFDLLETRTNQTELELRLRPRAVGARRWMPRLSVGLGLDDWALRYTEVEFADGSTLRNRFTNACLNPTLAPETFEPAIPSDYRTVVPAATHE